MKVDELIILVQSMDDREIRLYRRHAGQHERHGRSNYLDLFNALVDMPSYDADLLARRLADTPILPHLPIHVTRLFQHLMEFLRQSNQYPSIESQLNAACERIAIMVERGLIASARKELRRAQQMAHEHGKHLKSLRLAELERSFFFQESLGGPVPQFDIAQFRDRDILNGLQRDVEVQLTHLEARYLARTRKGSAQEAQALVRRLVGDSVSKAIQRSQASTADMMILDTIGIGAQIEGNYDLAYAAYAQMDSFWVSNPDKVADNAPLYVHSITNFLNACLVLGRHDDFRKLLSNLKTVHFTNEAHALLLRESLLYLELIFCLNRFEYEKGVALGPEIEALLRHKKLRISSSRLITLHFNMGSLHFLKGEYSKANRWFSQIIANPVPGYRRDVQEFLPVFQLLLFIAMEDRELLASRLRARLRGSGQERSGGLESAIMKLARHYLSKPMDEFREALDEFRTEMLAILGGPTREIGAGECLFWAEGRLKGKLPGEVLREYSAG